MTDNPHPHQTASGVLMMKTRSISKGSDSIMSIHEHQINHRLSRGSYRSHSLLYHSSRLCPNHRSHRVVTQGLLLWYRIKDILVRLYRLWLILRYSVQLHFLRFLRSRPFLRLSLCYNSQDSSFRGMDIKQSLIVIHGGCPRR